MRRRYGLYFSQIMSQLVNDNFFGLDRLGSRFIGKKRPAQPAFPMGLIARFTAGSLLWCHRNNFMILFSRFLLGSNNIFTHRAVSALCPSGAGTGGLHCRLDNNCMLGAVPGQRLEGQLDIGSIGLHKCVHLRARIAIHGNVHLSGAICVKRMSIIVIIQGIELDVGVREPHFGQFVAAFKEIGTNIAAFHCRFCQIGALAEHTVAAAFPVEALVQLYRAGNSDLGQSVAAHKD